MMKQIYTRLAICMLATASLSDALAQGPVLVSDINTVKRGSRPKSGALLANGKYVYSADIESIGHEPWITDGTEAGTTVLRNIAKESNGSFPRNFTSANTVVYFSAYVDTTGDELWKTDGTAQGTVLVKDLIPGGISSRPNSLVMNNGILYFIAEDQTYENQVWRSDGTSAGTYKVFPTNSHFDIRDLMVMGTDIYFVSSPSRNNFYPRTIWKSNGTEAGTVSVASFPNANPERLARLGNKILFSNNSVNEGTEPWITDGTTAGTSILKDIYQGMQGSEPNFARGGIAFGNTFYFTAKDSLHERELWKTDGTAAGTVLVKDIYVGSEQGSDASDMTILGNEILFSAVDSAYGYEIWKTDGTEAGTVLLKDALPGEDGSEPEEFIRVGNTVYFSTYTDETGYEIWKSDGTTAGTMLVYDLLPGENSSDPDVYAGINGKLLFAATDHPDAGEELYITDGTAAGTQLLKNVGGTLDSDVSQFTEFNGEVYFVAYSGKGDYFLYKTNGNIGNAVEVHPKARGIGGAGLTVYQNKLVFFANSDSVGQELHTYDPATKKLTLVADLNPGVDGIGSDEKLILFKNELYFNTYVPSVGNELWKTDGINITLVKDIYAGTEGSNPQKLTVIGNHLYFAAQDSAHGSELWRTDGSTTELVTDVNAGPDGSNPDNINGLGNAAYFTAESSNGLNLYKVVGGVTSMIDLDSTSTDASNASNLKLAGGKLFFNGYTSTYGTEMYAIRNDSVVLVKDLYEGNIGSGFSEGIAFDNQLYFMATTLINGVYDAEELWRTDGFTVKKVVDIGQGDENGSYANSFVVMGCNLFFKAYTQDLGYELWNVQKGLDTAFLVADLVSGSTDASISQLTPVNGTLYFRARDPFLGQELWKYEPTTVSVTNQATICYGDSITFDGVVRTESGIYKQLFSTSQGCDSLVSLNLTVRPQYITNFDYTLCFGTKVVIANRVIDSAGVYQAVIKTAQGCDSTLVLTVVVGPQINQITSTTTTLTAVADNAIYQWVNCQGFIPASGVSNTQSYTPTEAGSYAVIVLKDGCADTSECVSFTPPVGLEESMQSSMKLRVHPNPNTGTFYVQTNAAGTYKLINQLGQLVKEFTLDASNQYTIEMEHVENGIYFVVGSSESRNLSQKIIVNR
jgi:ELWxxDGT repeat protein